MKLRDRTWVAVIVMGVGLLIAAGLGLFGYIAFTSTPLHPNPQEVPSVMRSGSPPRWGGAAEQARQIVRASVTEQNLPGLSVAVGVGGDIVWAEGFGWADTEKRVPVAPDTQFRIGTASTALTSAAVGLLLEKERLKLDDEIQVYVPAFPKKQWPVTLRQVMGHLAGVTSDGGDEGPLFGEHCGRPVDALQHFAEQSLRFEPGTEDRYSRYDWILVSAAVEAAAEEPFFTFMQKHVFEPLGMDGTTADSARAAIPARATSYFPRFAADPRYGPDVMRDVDYSCYAGFERVPVHAVRPGPLRDGHRQRQAAAALDRPIAPDVTAAAFGPGDGIRTWLGSRDRRAGGEGHARGRPRRGPAGRDGGVLDDVS